MEKYIVIPENLLNDKDLCINAKILLAKINLLSYEKGYCYASNKYLGKIIQVSSRTITRLIGELKKANLITIKYSDENERRIYVN